MSRTKKAFKGFYIHLWIVEFVSLEMLEMNRMNFSDLWILRSSSKAPRSSRTGQLYHEQEKTTLLSVKGGHVLICCLWGRILGDVSENMKCTIPGSSHVLD